ncbi:MAG: type II secretion system F family protein, partial [Planctomycetota bacterium]
ASLGTTRINGEPLDLLGFGVGGWAAVTLYVQILIGCTVLVLGLIVGVRRGIVSLKPLQRWLLRVPKVGACIEKICMARLAWVLHLTLNVEMDLRQMVPLALRATGNDYYQQFSPSITKLVASGQPLHVAFGLAGPFPVHFIDALEVAEESGQISESMARLSAQYEQEAQASLRTLTTLLGAIIGGIIAVVIGAMIIRFVQVVYLDTLNDALNF